MNTMHRRSVIQQGSLAGLFAAAGSGCVSEPGTPPPYRALGVCAPVEQAWGIDVAGGEYIEESARRFLVPDKPEKTFQANLQKLEESPLPVAACNSFLPGSLRCTGTQANHQGILNYSDIVFRRCQEAEIKLIVFGSSASRKLEDGFSRDEAEAQFISLLKQMGFLAQTYGVTVALEPLRRQECNFINTVLQGAAIVEQVNHPNIRMVSDWYHMLQNGEDPADLLKVKEWIVHAHLAEKEKRSAPGVAGDDFRPFFSAFKQNGYRGRISIEGKWNIGELPLAFQTIKKQAREATV